MVSQVPGADINKSPGQRLGRSSVLSRGPKPQPLFRGSVERSLARARQASCQRKRRVWLWPVFFLHGERHPLAGHLEKSFPDLRVSSKLSQPHTLARVAFDVLVGWHYNAHWLANLSCPLCAPASASMSSFPSPYLISRSTSRSPPFAATMMRFATASRTVTSGAKPSQARS